VRIGAPTDKSPAGNPIANLLVVVVGILTIGAFIVLGVFAAVALGGIIAVMASVLAIRMWWLGRRLPQQDRAAKKTTHRHPSDVTVIEGEFQVVSSDQDENRPE